MKSALWLLVFSNALFAQPLLQESDLVPLGTFRVPDGGNDQNTFSYGGFALGYNPANNSLFLTGHSHHQRSAEISIPQIVGGESLSALKTATFIQPFADATEGRRTQINPADSNVQKIGGHLVYNGKLYVSAFSYYDAGNSQSASHFVRPLSLSTTGQVVGPVKVGANAHYTSAYMTMIPPEWREAFGGPALTGNCCRSIISVHSFGPAVSVFDPETMQSTELLRYTSSNPLGPGASTTNPLFNLTTKIEGVVFPRGTRSVLFFGYHGIGKYCYGEGSACNDPADSDKGTHAYPYVYQVWAYDADDLVEVKKGQRSSTNVLPYGVWTFNLPFEKDDGHEIGGAAYDAERGLIYLSLNKMVGARPLISVLSINTQSRPNAPSELMVH